MVPIDRSGAEARVSENPQYGWRVWAVPFRPGQPVLLPSPWETSEVWEPQAEWSAVCNRASAVERNQANEELVREYETALAGYEALNGKHTPPGEFCSCGIYAAATPLKAAAYIGGGRPDRLVKRFQHGDKGEYVFGKVHLRGRVLPGWGGTSTPDEVRAERAELVGLYVPSGRPFARLVAKELERAYGVPAKTVRSKDVAALR
jgi:hypothetical protein